MIVFELPKVIFFISLKRFSKNKAFALLWNKSIEPSGKAAITVKDSSLNDGRYIATSLSGLIWNELTIAYLSYSNS